METNVMAGAERIEEVPEATRGCAAGIKLVGWSVRQADGEAAEHLVPVKRTATGEQVQQALDTAWRELERTLSWWEAEYRRQTPEPIG